VVDSAPAQAAHRGQNPADQAQVGAALQGHGGICRSLEPIGRGRAGPI